jgi:hypothetical protein
MMKQARICSSKRMDAAAVIIINKRCSSND